MEEIKMAIMQLPLPDLLDFRAWYKQFEAELWDKQIEADIKAGKLDNLAEEALADYQTGCCTELSEQTQLRRESNGGIKGV